MRALNSMDAFISLIPDHLHSEVPVTHEVKHDFNIGGIGAEVYFLVKCLPMINH